jgi:hypothetical protein
MKSFKFFFKSLSGIFNVYCLSDTQINSVDEIDSIIGVGFESTSQKQDRSNLSKDYTNVKKDLFTSWNKRELVH